MQAQQDQSKKRMCYNLVFCGSLSAQEAESLLDQGAALGFVWALEVKGYSIQNTIGIGYWAHFSVLIKNIATSFGWTGVMNISHPEVNFGYMGLFSQYTYAPKSLFHFSGQLLLGIGSTKDYQQPKSSSFDNFGNITGPGFYVIEPGINGEMHFHTMVLEFYSAVDGRGSRGSPQSDRSYFNISLANCTIIVYTAIV
jgi:hypothetical protein